MHLSISFASALVVGDGEIINQLKEPSHGWPNMTVWCFKPNVWVMPIIELNKGFKGKRIFFHEAEVEYINQKTNGAFLELCAGGQDNHFVLLAKKQEVLTTLQLMLPEFPEQVGNWFFRWKLELLLRYAVNGVIYNGPKALLLVNKA